MDSIYVKMEIDKGVIREITVLCVSKRVVNVGNSRGYLLKVLKTENQSEGHLNETQNNS